MKLKLNNMKNHKESCHHKDDNDTLPSDVRCKCICSCPTIPDNAQRTGDKGRVEKFDNIIKEWKEIEPETIDHLMTVLDVYAHDSADGHMTPESFEKAVSYIKSWVMYRSQFVRELVKSIKEKNI